MTGTPGAPAWNFCIRNSPGREEGNKEILNVEKKKNAKSGCKTCISHKGNRRKDDLTVALFFFFFWISCW